MDVDPPAPVEPAPSPDAAALAPVDDGPGWRASAAWTVLAILVLACVAVAFDVDALTSVLDVRRAFR